MNRHVAAVAMGLALSVALYGSALAANSSFSAKKVAVSKEFEPRAAQALTDLEFAKWMLSNSKEGRANDRNTDLAIYEATQAIQDINMVFRLEPGSAPKKPADADVVRGRDDRLHAAARYLTAALTDLKAPEDENPPNAWRTHAHDRAWSALHYTELALKQPAQPGVSAESEPRAAQALTDLEFAKWMLSNSKEGRANDRNTDLAIYEATQAIQDINMVFRLEPGSAPKKPADADVVRGRDDRLHAAARYLTAALTDLKAPEDENPPNAWRTHAHDRAWSALHYTELALKQPAR